MNHKKILMKKNKVPAWERRGTSTPYNIEQFEANKRILIVCEGQTETIYFKSFDVLLLEVHCIDSKGRTKRQLIQYCEETVNQHKKRNLTFDEIWCVFDMDINKGENEFADFDNAISSATTKGYKVAYSNDAFELWFYLHYEFTDQQNRRTFYYRELSKYWGMNYEKNGKAENFCRKIYNLLENDARCSQTKAIHNAIRLHNDQQHLVHSKQNPVTTVYLLVRELNKYLKGVKRS